MAERVRAETILVVDDEPEIRELVSLRLTGLGYNVLEAGDGQDALGMVAGHHVDVVISDLMMPRMSGLTLLTTLRNSGFNRPFIFVTAYPSQDSTLQALRLGAFDYIEKPFDTDELMELVREAMRVSCDLQRLVPGAGALAPLSRSVPAGPVEEISKLRTLRHDADRADEAPPAAATRPDQMVEVFVSEVTPQLMFCEGAIKGLASDEDRGFELGYLFRVAQTVAGAAETLDLQDLGRFARGAERLYTALRVRPQAVDDAMIVLARRTNDALRSIVEELGVSTKAPQGAGREALLVELLAAADSLEGKVQRRAG